MTNDGDEAHHMVIGLLKEGVSLDDALAADEAEEVTELDVETDPVGPGEETVLTFENLEPGEYAMVCFLPTDDGTPHAFEGMATSFTVS